MCAAVLAVSVLTALAVSQVFYSGGAEDEGDILFYESAFARPKEYFFNGNTYNDGSLIVNCWSESMELDGRTVKVNFADVQVSSSDQLCTAFAGGGWKSGIRSSVTEIAWENNAVAAVNGDNAYDGVVISNGSVLSCEPKNIDLLLVDSRGDFVIFNDKEFVSEGLHDSGEYSQSFSFGPVLTQDGEISIGERSVSCSPDSAKARTAVGQLGERHYLLCTVEKSSSSAGATIEQLAGIMQSKGCVTSYNLCGGRQSDMSFHDMRFGGSSAEPAVGNILCFMTAQKEAVTDAE